MFLDEPTAALDATAEHEVLGLIERLREKRGAAVVMVTHLVEDGLERADRALLLDRDHGVALSAPPAAMRASPDFARIYGRFVGRGQGKAARDRHRRRAQLAGAVVEPFDLQGCDLGRRSGGRAAGSDPVRALNVFPFLSIGLSVALCTRALGALPVFAFSVLPAMTALALTARIGLVFVLAGLIGAASGVSGYVVSFKGDLPVGATQTMTAAALLGAALAWRFARTRYERRARTTSEPRTDAA